MKLEWFVARRYLASGSGTRFLSLITLICIGGVTVGVMALIVVTAVMTGLQVELRTKILGTNPHLWVLELGDGMRMADWRTVLERVRERPDVVAAAPFVRTEVGLRNEAGYAEGAILWGIDSSAPGEPVTDIARQIRAGELSLSPGSSGHPAVLLGESLALRFRAYPGALVTLISLQDAEITSLGAPMPTMRRFEVVGTFRTGMYEFDNKYMYTTVAAAQEISALGDMVSGIEVRIPEQMEAQRSGEQIAQSLGTRYYAQDWNTMNAALFEALKLEKLAMGIILSLIIVVAAFNIVCTLVMLVAEKTREIGILKAMGMTPPQIQRLFQVQGLVIGATGTLLGAAGGLGLAWIQDRYRLISLSGEVYFIDHLPVIIDPVDIGVIVSLSVLISFLATVLPARQAARLTPIEAIRHE